MDEEYRIVSRLEVSISGIYVVYYCPQYRNDRTMWILKNNVTDWLHDEDGWMNYDRELRFDNMESAEKYIDGKVKIKMYGKKIHPYIPEIKV